MKKVSIFKLFAAALLAIPVLASASTTYHITIPAPGVKSGSSASTVGSITAGLANVTEDPVNSGNWSSVWTDGSGNETSLHSYHIIAKSSLLSHFSTSFPSYAICWSNVGRYIISESR